MHIICGDLLLINYLYTERRPQRVSRYPFLPIFNLAIAQLSPVVVYSSFRAFNIGEYVTEGCAKGNNIREPLPNPLSENEIQLRDFQKRCHTLCLRILRYIAIGLKVNTTTCSNNLKILG